MNEVFNPTLHDVFMVALGHQACVVSYGLVEVSRKALDEGRCDVDELGFFFDSLKDLQLSDGTTWGDWLPAGNPCTNQSEWTWEGIRFLSDRVQYTIAAGECAAEGPSAEGDVLRNIHVRVATALELCPAYDAVWPEVETYMLMSGFDGEVVEGAVEKARMLLSSKRFHEPSVNLLVENSLARNLVKFAIDPDSGQPLMMKTTS